MSREIKFRAWLKPRWEDDEDADKMYYDIQNSYDTLGDVKPYDPMTNFASWFDDNVAVVEQYTGLKDKNGKEIYEGDIVKFGDLELAMKPAGVVCFSDGKFFIKDWEFDDGSYHIVDFYDYNIPYRDFEVIGNVHENPELLESKPLGK